MTILIPDAEAVRDIAAIAKDFERLASTGAPAEEDLAGAPFINRWELVPRFVICLSGAISGHPRFGGARTGRTSPLLAVDSTRGWARTLNRWYRLGLKASDDSRREQ